MRGTIFIAGTLIAGAAIAQSPARSAQDEEAGKRVAAACGGELSKAEFAKLSQAKRTAKLACYTREAGANFNKTLPKKVDALTTLERVSAEGTRLTYYYRLDAGKADIKPGAIEAFKPTIRKKVCDSADMRSTIGSGGSYQYYWDDRDGVRLADLLVDAC